MLLSYVAVIERNAEGRFFAHLPDLPGATAAGSTAGEALRNLSDIAADHLADLANDGEDIPEPTDFDAVPRDPEVEEHARALVTVEAPGRTVKISLSIDEGLLKRVDHAASKAGLTRSGFFADACYQRLRQEVVSSGDWVDMTSGGTRVRNFLAGQTETIIGGLRLDQSRNEAGLVPLAYIDSRKGPMFYAVAIHPRDAKSGEFMKITPKGKAAVAGSSARKSR